MLQRVSPPLFAGSRSGFVRPLIPTLVNEPPAGDGWLHEIKHDGYRTVLVIDGGQAVAFTRNGHDWTTRYRRVCDAAELLGCRSAVLDGEMVVQGENGVSDFNALRADIERGGQRLVLFAFDLLHLDGRDVRSAPLIERRELLRALIPADPVQFSDQFNGDGAELFAAADAMGLEGIVSKRMTSRYQSGRSTAWLKTKCFTTDEFVVIGVAHEPKGRPVALLAREQDGTLRYAGTAFIGLARAEREAFWTRLPKLAVERAVLPELRRKKAFWVRPELSVRVKHLKGTGGLRHASVQGLA